MTRHFPIRPGWNLVTVILMVVGFIVAWPLGLAVLAYILWGDRLNALVDEQLYRYRSREAHRAVSGNTAFDDYRARELDRLEAERKKLDQMREEFDEFLRSLRRAKDQQEFDRFMAERHRASAVTPTDDRGNTARAPA